MSAKDCIFCKIVKGSLQSVKIWENKEFLAILDIYPNTKGMALVLTKKHHNADLFEMSDRMFSKYLLSTKIVARLLEKKLNVKRVGLVIEGMAVNHAHIKLYPFHGLKTKFDIIWEGDPIYFEKYPGYILTRPGNKKSIDELEKIAKSIKKSKI